VTDGGKAEGKIGMYGRYIKRLMDIAGAGLCLDPVDAGAGGHCPVGEGENGLPGAFQANPATAA